MKSATTSSAPPVFSRGRRPVRWEKRTRRFLLWKISGTGKVRNPMKMCLRIITTLLTESNLNMILIELFEVEDYRVFQGSALSPEVDHSIGIVGHWLPAYLEYIHRVHMFALGGAFGKQSLSLLDASCQISHVTHLGRKSTFLVLLQV